MSLCLINQSINRGMYRDYLSYFQLRYGDPALRRAIPLALGLLSVSNPKLPVMDTLSKFSHDNDSEVASNSVFGMGLIGAG